MNLVQPSGFLALPTSGKGKAVLVLHAWWGLNKTMKDICTRLAGEGFTAFAPDLYHGKLATTIPEAEALRDALDWKSAIPEVNSAAEYLQGICRGPGPTNRCDRFFAWRVLCPEPFRHRTGADRESDRVLRHRSGGFHENQSGLPRALCGKRSLRTGNRGEGVAGIPRAAGRKVTFHRYPGTGHWFFEPDRVDAFNPEAARIAWERTLSFLKT